MLPLPVLHRSIYHSCPSDAYTHHHLLSCLPQVPADLRILLEADHHANLSRMGVLAALAVGMHNLPEGLATFIAALASPTAGIAMAVAIALHNIPEGIIVAMPIYYASGSKWKGFLWSAISGLSEVVGALLVSCG